MSERFNRDGSIMTAGDIQRQRIKLGQCTTCPEGDPTQCFTFKHSRLNPLRDRRRLPLTVKGRVYNGVCLLCHPDFDPGRRLSQKARSLKTVSDKMLIRSSVVGQGSSRPSCGAASTTSITSGSCWSMGESISSVDACSSSTPESQDSRRSRRKKWPPPDIGEHAFVTYDEVKASGPPAPARPLLHPARTCVRGARIRVVSAHGLPEDAAADSSYVLRTGDKPPERAYRRIKEKPARMDPGGNAVCCLVLERDEFSAWDSDGGGLPLFREPEEGDHSLVWIRNIRKESQAFDDLRCGQVENRSWRGRHQRPDDGRVDALELEVQEHLALHDGRCVMECLEVLEDDRNLYVVTPYYDSAIGMDFTSHTGMPEYRARRYFRNLLEGLHHLQSAGLCHGDLNPDSIVLHKGRIKISELGLRCRALPFSGDGSRLLMKPGEQCGSSSSYICPEAWTRDANGLDGFAVDLWSVGTILYTMLTGTKLYSIPLPVDKMYRFNIMCGGLSNDPSNKPDAMALLQEMSFTKEDVPEKWSISRMSHSHVNLSWEVVDLLDSMLQPDPADRMTLAQVMVHTWVTSSQISQV